MFYIKDQLISKGLFGILEFFQKNERKNSSYVVLLGKKPPEFVRSFFGRIVGLKEPLRFCLTFTRKTPTINFL